MNLKQLRYFQVVAQIEHMRQAADELAIAQPALSRAIASLEKELEVPLFNRVGRQLQLNQFGRAYLQRVERIFNELEAGQRQINDLAEPESGQVGLAALHTIGAQLLPELISKYRQQHPNVAFRLFQNGRNFSCRPLTTPVGKPQSHSLEGSSKRSVCEFEVRL